MIQFFRGLQFESISFWSGFIAATLLWWLLRFTRPTLKKIWEIFKEKLKRMGESIKVNAEGRYRDAVLIYTQERHLAAPFFSLDEILLPPRFLAHPPGIDPDLPPPYEEIISTLIPNMPDQPEMASAYNAKTLDIISTLQHVQKIAIYGNPGTGKTTTLAYIAAALSRKLPELGSLQNFLPVYLHCSDLIQTEQETDNPLLLLVGALTPQIRGINQNRLAGLLGSFFREGKVVLMVDGLDETYSLELSKCLEVIKSVLSHHPQIRCIVAADANHINGLPELGFSFFNLAIWDTRTQVQFIHKWSNLWTKFIESPGRRWDDIKIDPFLINGWMLNLESATTPLDFTLKVWAAYAGDSLGPRSVNALEAYLRRLTVRIPKSRPTLELLATIFALKMESAFTDNDARKWLLEGKRETEIARKNVGESSGEEGEIPRWEIDPDVIPSLVEIGLLRQSNGSKVRFAHPILLAYLAGSTLPPNEMLAILAQPGCALKDYTLSFFTYHPELDLIIQKSLSGTKDPLLRERLSVARWLSNIPNDAPIQRAILTQLSKDIQNEMLPAGLKMRLFSAMVLSGHPTILSLIRQFLLSNSAYLRQLATLGCGYLRDLQFLGELVKKLKDTTNVSQAACFALVNIATKPALEAVVSALLSGNEALARAAAEAFAANPKEGFPILVDGSKMESLPVRRAVIYGLRKVNQPWAVEILQEMQIEDSQWVIKDAAAQAVEDISHPDPIIIRTQPPLEDLPWLITFAGERGQGISPGKPALDMLLRVPREGKEEEILAALDQMRIRGVTDFIPFIYPYYYGDNPHIKEAAYCLLVQVASMGVEIPPLDQVGLSG
jgi:hypothetical protein